MDAAVAYLSEESIRDELHTVLKQRLRGCPLEYSVIVTGSVCWMRPSRLMRALSPDLVGTNS